MLIGFLAFIWTGTVLQLFTALICAILFFALQLSAQPYKLPTSNFVGTLGAAGVTFVFVATLAYQCLPLLWTEGQSSTGESSTDASAASKANAEAFIGFALTLAALLVVVGMFTVYIQAYVAERRKQVLFWRTDRHKVEAPKLTKQHPFHCFISHCWASGQADARAMKASIVNLVRDLRVFLDGEAPLRPRA